MTTTVTTLSNGLRIVTDPVPSVETLALGVWIGTGTRDEDLTHNGAAHMVEHMLFKGTKNRNALQIVEQIEDVGGNVNAYTSRERTSYHIHLLKQDLPLALDILADIIQNSTMPDDEIERERDVILQEIGMCHDTPDDIIFDQYFEAAYPNQSAGAPILGTNEIIQNMDRKTLMNFVEKLYTPERMIICASGNFDPDHLIKMVEQKFADLSPGQNQTQPTAHYKSAEHRDARATLEQSHVILGFQSIPHVSDDHHTAQLLNMLMGGGMSSRLFQEVREKRGLVYSIYSFNSAYRDYGQFGIYAGTGPDKLPELVPVICDEIKKAQDTITEEELTRAKAQLSASILMARESMMRRADHNAKILLLHGNLKSPQEIIEKIKAVTVKDVQNIAQQIFGTQPSLAALGPLDHLEDFKKTKQRLTA